MGVITLDLTVLKLTKTTVTTIENQIGKFFG